MRNTFYTLLAWACFFHSLAGAAVSDPRGLLPNFDKRVPAPVPEAVAATHAQARAALAAQAPTAVVERDALLGAPVLVHAPGGLLGGPTDGTVAAAGVSAKDPHRAVKAFVSNHRDLFGHGPEALDAARIKREFVTAHSGMNTVIWEQSLDGIPVFEALFTGHTTKAGQLISVSSRFVPQPAAAADRGTPGRAVLVAAPKITREAAIALAAGNVGSEAAPAASKGAKSKPNPAIAQTFGAAALKGEVRANLVWLPVRADDLRLCWQVELATKNRAGLYRVLVDARSGEIWVRHCLTFNLTPATFRVYTSDSPTPFSPGLAVPGTTQPPEVARQLLTLSALDTEASPNGWINDADNETKGNNVDAHLDRNDDDEPDLPRPHGSPNRVFDFPMDLTKGPDTYTNAAVVQLFYWNNWMHDKLYELGFTEEAGNYQNSNFGKGGLGNDAVQADAQDGGGFENANFSAPDDGIPGRMQMYLFPSPNPDRDGDFDAEVILHEYTHGLSGRLVGGGVGITALQTEGMGEGWSDFYAICLLSEQGDDIDGNYAAGAYLSYKLAGLEQNYYYGIRRYPYTTDLSKNPLTFKDIDPRQADSHRGVPESPIGGGPAEEVHNQGEVWCVTLWDVRANLIKKHGFATGNHLTLQLVTDGMKLSPPNPNFLQARDAILQADVVMNQGANRDELWAAFAKRGMGFGASSPRSSTTAGVVEAFDVPDDLLILGAGNLVASGPEGGPFSPTRAEFTFSNVGTNAVKWTSSASAGWYSLDTTSGKIAVGGAPVRVVVQLDPIASSLPAGLYREVLSFTNETTGRVQSRPVSLRVGQRDFLTASYDSPGHPFANRSFTFTPDGSPNFYSVCSEPTDAFAIDPGVGQPVLLADDGFKEIPLKPESAISLFGTNYSRLFVSGNGSLTFLRGSSDFDNSPEVHFGSPRVSGLFTDLDPSSGGVVSVAELPDRVAVSFVDVPGYHEIAGNSFQMELFFDGVIRLTYLDEAASYALVGLSRGGGVPDGFAESNFASYGACLPPLRLELPLTASEGGPVQHGRVLLPAPLATNLVVTLVSANTVDISIPPSISIPAGRTSAEFTVTLIDNGLPDGTRLARIVAGSDGFISAGAVIKVVDDESATFSLNAPANVTEGVGILPGQGRIELDTPLPLAVIVGLTSSDPQKVAVPEIVIVPAGRKSVSFDLNIPDDRKIDGAVTVELKAQVLNWPGTAARIVVADNEVSVLALSTPVQLGEGTGLHAGRGVVRSSGTLAADLTVSLESSDPARLVVPASVVLPAGELSVSFDLVTPDNDLLEGAKPVLVTALAPTFVGGTSSVLIVDDETPPVPSGPLPAHLSANNSPNVDLSWTPLSGEILRNGGFESGDLTGWTVEKQGSGDWLVNDGSLDPEGPADPAAPNTGRYDVVSQQSASGEGVLLQEVTIPSGVVGATLSWSDQIANDAGFFLPGYQEFRVEIRSQEGEPLATAFSTLFSDAPTSPWTRRTYDLGDFAGKTVRIAFVEKHSFGYLNVRLDEVGVNLLSKPPVYEVYFGKHADLGPADSLGTTTANSWPLPKLDLETTYFWRVAARHIGETVGPVWQFSVPGVGPLDHFAWQPILPPAFINEPFPVSLAAEDVFGNVVTNYTGRPAVTGRLDFPEVEIGAGVDSWDAPLGGLGTQSRLEAIYLQKEVGQARRITGLALNVSALPGAQVTRWTIRMKHSVLKSFSDSASWDRTGWTTVYQKTEDLRATGWTYFAFSTPFDYDGKSSLLIDFSYKNAEFSFGGESRGSFASQNRSIYYQDFGDYADPLTWSGSTSPAPLSTFEYPNIRLASDLPIPVDASPVFVDGLWSGFATVTNLVSGLVLRAQDDDDHFGLSAPVTMLAKNDLAVTLQVSPDPITALQEITCVSALTNSGPLAATGVMLTNTLAPTVTIVSVVSSQGTFTQNGSVVVFDLGTIESGAAVSATVVARVGSAAAVLTTKAAIARQEPDGYLANNSASVTTTVNPKPGISPADVTVTEGTGGTNYVDVPVTLSVASSQEVSVNYATLDSTAKQPGDYTSVSGTLRFPPGVVSQNVRIPIIADDIDEAIENFRLNLSVPVNATLSDSQATITIEDDDGPTISIDDISVVEGNSGTVTATFHVTLSHPSPQRVTVDYQTVNGSAVADGDYTKKSGTLTFPLGNTNQVVSVVVKGDILIEPNERFYVELSNPVFASLQTSRGSCVILTDDGLPGVLDRFRWSPIPAFQSAADPFPVTITAADAKNNWVTNYSGAAVLSAAVLYPDKIVGDGQDSWDYPMGTFYEDSRIQCIYLPGEIGAARRLTCLALFVDTPPAITLPRWTIRLKHTALAEYPGDGAWERSGWTTCYQKNETITQKGWVNFQFTTPFQFNGSDNLMVDISFNGTAFDFTDVQCRFTETPTARALFGRADSDFGDPLTWNARTPLPEMGTQLPNIRLSSSTAFPIAPTSVQFTNGVWSGFVTLSALANDLTLQARDAVGHLGVANTISVLPLEDSDHDGLPNAYERSFNLDPNAADADLDSDGDGLTNRQEFLAGTDPRDPSSRVWIEVGVADASILFRFPTVPGKTYQIETAVDAASNAWSPLGDPVVGSGEKHEGRFPAPASPTAFFRLKVLPQ